MKAAYFDCIAGASGDMILGALIDAGLDADWLRSELGKLPIDGWQLLTRRVSKNGFSAVKVDVVVAPQPHARPLPAIERIITESKLDEEIKTQALAVIRLIVREEARIHNMEMSQVHLHEVGGEDAIIDIVGALLGIARLGIERIECSPLPLGRGFVKGAHGSIPLPAPATAAILKGLPIVGSPIQMELVTPTGAALLKHLGAKFGEIPAMRLESIGYGAGTRDLSIPNVLRVFVGEVEDVGLYQNDSVTILETNIDDQNPEHFQYIMEKAMAAGALDVSLTPIHMKKNRSGVTLSIMAKPEQKAALRDLMLSETTSLGVREQELRRVTLPREQVEVQTPWGKTTVKIGHLPNGSHKYAPEYEDCRQLAAASGISLREIYAAAESAARELHEGQFIDEWE